MNKRMLMDTPDHPNGPRFGLTLSSEEHEPSRLVELAQMAEEAGFDFVSISDHYHPWIDAQGHSANVWPVLGAIAASTESLDVAVGVTCPIMRIHPAVLAQATATTARLFDGRFTWGVGTGEALNEHIIGERWPTAPERIEMLKEAIEIIRLLWRGEECSYDGMYFTVENARVYDAPVEPIPVIVSAFGPKAAEMAAEIGDGLWTSDSKTEGIDAWRAAGGVGPVYAQISLCYGDDRQRCIDTVHKIWPNSAIPGQLAQDLPTPKHFEQAAELVTPDKLAEQMPCGPDVDRLVEAAQQAIGHGIDHVYFHQIGPDQEKFCQLWKSELADRLRTRQTVSA
jgi:coenzyme F420-dependent glucose-6-phosphate dehydrogenase